jgi:hypothetical protein
LLIHDTNISSSFFYGDFLIEYIVHYRGVGVDLKVGLKKWTRKRRGKLQKWTREWGISLKVCGGSSSHD